MKTIHKFPLSLLTITIIELPEDAEIVHVGVDPKEEICLWVMLDPKEADLYVRQFTILGTGVEIDQDLAYRGTVRQIPFIWHIFEVR